MEVSARGFGLTGESTRRWLFKNQVRKVLFIDKDGIQVLKESHDLLKRCFLVSSTLNEIVGSKVNKGRIKQLLVILSVAFLYTFQCSLYLLPQERLLTSSACPPCTAWSSWSTLLLHTLGLHPQHCSRQDHPKKSTKAIFSRPWLIWGHSSMTWNTLDLITWLSFFVAILTTSLVISFLKHRPSFLTAFLAIHFDGFTLFITQQLPIQVNY